MAIITNTMTNLTLLRLRAMRPDWFYEQNWYDAEEFANTPCKVGDIDTEKPMLAVEAVWAAIQDPNLWSKLSYKYLWTLDYDHNGDQVYLGQWYGGSYGLQIHRHLTIKPEQFLNNETFT